jgi:hypothetical protein
VVEGTRGGATSVHSHCIEVRPTAAYAAIETRPSVEVVLFGRLKSILVRLDPPVCGGEFVFVVRKKRAARRSAKALAGDVLSKIEETCTRKQSHPDSSPTDGTHIPNETFIRIVQPWSRG